SSLFMSRVQKSSIALFCVATFILGLCFLITSPVSPSQLVFRHIEIAAYLPTNKTSILNNTAQNPRKNLDLTLIYQHECLSKLDREDYQGAIGDCSEALNEYSEPTVYINRGLAHYRLGSYEQAIIDFDKSIALEPENWQAYFNRGLAKSAQADFSAAITDYETALVQSKHESAADRAKIFNERGVAHYETGTYQKAEADFAMAAVLNPRNPEIFFNLGCTHQLLSKSAQAIVDYDNAIAINPQYSEAYANRGFLHKSLGNYKAAITDLKSALDHLAAELEPRAHELITVIQQLSSLYVVG
ncbi:MAG: tetratricopeptide repeat protein, partial [Cyanobacteria bacterium P01_H01_bin.15]